MGRAIAKVQLRVRIEPDEDWFIGYAPALPGLNIDAPTKEETWEMLKVGVAQHLRAMMRHSIPFPENGPDFREYDVSRDDIMTAEEASKSVPSESLMTVNV